MQNASMEEIKGKKNVAAIMEVLSNEGPEICQSMADVIRGWGESAISAFILRTRQEKREDVKEKAVSVLLAIKQPAVKPLIKSLKDGYGNAAIILGKIGDKRAVRVLIKTLKNEIGLYRQGAMWALGEIRDRRAVKPLIKSIKQNRGYGTYLVKEAVTALGKIGDKKALEPLKDLLQTEDQELRKLVCDIIKGIKGQ